MTMHNTNIIVLLMTIRFDLNIPLVYTCDTTCSTAPFMKFWRIWESEFEKNYRPLVIDDVISKVCEIVDDESNKGRERLKIFIGVALAVERLLDESILNDDCVICLEELGRKKPLSYPPCSHVFHADCMATWLEHSLSCLICRCDLSPIKLNSFVLHFFLQNM
ncbi:RING-H2 finger protein ATL39-like [Capsicum galapagoense]